MGRWNYSTDFGGKRRSRISFSTCSTGSWSSLCLEDLRRDLTRVLRQKIVKEGQFLDPLHNNQQTRDAFFPSPNTDILGYTLVSIKFWIEIGFAFQHQFPQLNSVPRNEKRFSCGAVEMHRSFWETMAKMDEDFIHWWLSWQNSAIPFSAVTNPWLAQREEKWLRVQLEAVLIGGNSRLLYKRWTFRRWHGGWRTRGPWCWGLWKAGGARGRGGGTPSPGRSGLWLPSPRPAGCSANSTRTRCSVLQGQYLQVWDI